MQSFAVFIAVLLPWLNPFSFGPSPAAVQSLLTLGCLAVVLWWARRVPMDKVSAGAWLSAALVSAMIGLLQYFGVAEVLRPWVNTTDVGEAFANLRQRNQFATLTNIGLAALLWWAARRPSRPLNGSGFGAREWRLAAMAAAALLALGNAASSSRTGLLQLLLLLAMAWSWHRAGGRGWSDRGLVLLAAAAGSLAAPFARPLLAGLDSGASGIVGRLRDGGEHCMSRLTLWSNVMHLITQKPWLGWGWGELSYAHFMTLYPGERFCDILDNAHNLPLHLAVELGMPLSALVCSAAAWLIVKNKPWRETDETRQLAWAVLALLLLHSMLEYPLWYGPFQMALGLGIFLLWPARGHRAKPGFVPNLLAILLLVGVAYASWDYRRISQIYQATELRDDAYRDNTREKIGDSWLFRQQVRFAELTTASLTTGNAAYLHDLAAGVLHFSPEPRVVEKLIESATLLGLADERQLYMLRYQAAFPQSQKTWMEEGEEADPDPEPDETPAGRP